VGFTSRRWQVTLHHFEPLRSLLPATFVAQSLSPGVALVACLISLSPF
jgi:hypothetical protein